MEKTLIKILKSLIYSLLLGFLFIFLFNFTNLLYPVIEMDLNSTPVVVFWWLILTLILFWYFILRKKIILVILGIVLYILLVAGFFQKDCSCQNTFFILPRSRFDSFKCGDIACAREKMTDFQRQVNHYLLKPVWEKEPKYD